MSTQTNPFTFEPEDENSEAEDVISGFSAEPANSEEEKLIEVSQESFLSQSENTLHGDLPNYPDEITPPQFAITISIIDGETWDSLPIKERVERAVKIGLSGKYGSKSWADLTLDERAILSGNIPDPKFDYQIKSHIVLEDSDRQSWGIVRDTNNDFTWKRGEGLIIGTWTKSPVDGLLHAFLETSIAALHDKSTQAYYQKIEDSRNQAAAPKKRASSTRTPKAPKEPAPVVESATDKALSAIAALKAKMGIK